MNVLILTLLMGAPQVPSSPANAPVADAPVVAPVKKKTDATCLNVFDQSQNCKALQKETPLVAADAIAAQNKESDAAREKVAKRFLSLGGASLISSVGLLIYSHSVGETLKTLAAQKSLDGESFRLLRNRERGVVWGGVITAFAGAMFMAAGTSFLVFDPKEGSLTDAFSFMTE